MQASGTNRLSTAAAATSTKQAQVDHHHASRHDKGQHAAPPFEGDVSEWGKTQLESFYDEESEVGPEVSEISSGISPRDMRPRLKPFDMDEAKQTLAYQSDMFSRAQALRRDGCAPAAMGVPDDLPTRMAYEQLHVLAGMAGKVQDAILHNKRIFEQRMMSEGRALQRRCLHGWLVLMQQKAAKRSKLARVQGRIQRGLLLRVFYSWKDELPHVDKTLAMTRKVAIGTARGCVRRVFAAWLLLARERWWKSQMASMESQIALMEGKLRGYEKRPIQVLRKRCLDHLVSAWLVEAVWSRHKREQGAKAASWRRKHTQQRAWDAWGAVVSVKTQQRMVAQRVSKNCQHIKQQAAWDAWLQAIECKHLKQQQLQAAAQHYTQVTRVKLWRAWHSRAKQNRAGRAAANRWKRPCMSRAFKFWLWYASKQKRQKLALKRSSAKKQQKLLQGAFACWVEYVGNRHLKTQLGQKQGLQDELERLKAENARLQRDNERFVRLVDSGEWGRGRVAELTAAGELMRAERDALLKLVQALRREYEAVQLAKESQHDELRALKDKMTVKGAARNCLLVKGGSSFNALVRALKQDLVDSGTAAKDPALLYQIDKLSMDRVQVYPDGELNIQAVTSGPQGNRSSTQQHSQPGSPSQRRTQSPPRAPTQAPLTDTAAADISMGPNSRLRIKTGSYSAAGSPSASLNATEGIGSLTGSPTKFASAGGSGPFYTGSPKGAGFSGGSPLRQPGQRAVSAAAAAAAAATAAAVVGGRVQGMQHSTLSVNASPVKGAMMGGDPAAMGYSPTRGHVQQQQAFGQGMTSTDNMLQALSNLTPAQVQRLATAGQQQQQWAGDQRPQSAGGGSSGPMTGRGAWARSASRGSNRS